VGLHKRHTQIFDRLAASERKSSAVMANLSTLYSYSNLPPIYWEESPPVEQVLPVANPSPALPIGSAAILSLENGNLGGKPFKLSAFGTLNIVGGSQTFQIKLYLVPGNVSPLQAANPSYLTSLFPSPLVSYTASSSTVGNFAISSTLLWDASSMLLGGTATGFYNTGSVTPIDATTSLSITTGGSPQNATVSPSLLYPVTSNVITGLQSITSLAFAVSFSLTVGTVNVSEWSIAQL
jgi:hypothetical protein